MTSKTGEGKGNFYTGTESFFGVFTQCQVYLSGVRLVHDGKITQQVSDLASQIENGRRKFLHSGEVNLAIQDLSRITNSYNQRVQAWESEASRRERNKKTMSGGALAKMKSELSMVRTHVRLASRTLNKLEIELHQIAGKESTELAKLRRPAESINDDPDGVSEPNAAASVENQKPVLSAEEQAQAAECLRRVNLFLKQLVGDSFLVSFEKANLKIAEDPDRLEQVWDSPPGTELPIFLVAGWIVKHPDPDGINSARKKLDLCFWLVPKSRNASKALRLVDGQVELWISSRKLDSARVSFGLATESERPKSNLISGFMDKFANKYESESPNLLVAHFRNLEWMQKSVIMSCSENGV